MNFHVYIRMLLTLVTSSSALNGKVFCPYANPCEGIKCEKSHKCVPNLTECSYSCQPECTEPVVCNQISGVCKENTCQGVCKNSPCSCSPICEISRACNIMCYDIHTPVCGSDQKTYKNICQLRYTSCKLKGKIRLKYLGQCGCELTFCDKNPCRTKKCNRGEKCFPDFCSGGCFGQCMKWY